MSGYYVAPRAQADVDEIWLYVAEDRPSAADRLIDRIIDHFSLLANHPDLGEVSSLTADARQSTVGNYVVVYRRRPERIEILRVIHSARDITAEFQRYWPG